MNNYQKHINTLVYAVCGAGKTELVYAVIEYALKNKLQVGFAIPRRDVVIELSLRLQDAFKKYKVVCVYGGNTSVLEGDIICLTTHQLFRYEKYFDLLILDEVDAFPYKDNEVLESFFNRSVRGNHVLMSATPSDNLLSKYNKEGFGIVTLFKRYHGKKIPEPSIFVNLKIVNYIYLFYKFKQFMKEEKPLLIFSPTIEECENLYTIMKLFRINGNFVHSKCKDRSLRIEKFRKSEYKFLVTTAVLERGVTLKNLQVIIFNASSFIYTKEALIQISGRVGRKKDATDGEVIFIGSRKTKEMVEARQTIIDANKNL